ncbi:hypothetical protein Phum_PHUM516710 [Pediculus humanus corporis]|uniref:Uncharacterized protein n=1 Tax=Pediculus humanus subsp. corporis TaxID=121224 RepID=E0VYQ2_PEDHC|nr:uncharacterized protein Phum_PHUM516710 [Pediculus humanus corporis]EEB18508.1 hypothetical protein Phum_PHUM516710 [Pediculus humanus corporis]
MTTRNELFKSGVSRKIDDDVSIKSEDENSVGDGDSCGSGPESVIIEKEDDGKSPSPEESGVNGEEIINSSSTSQAVISAGLVSTGGGYPRVLYQTSNGMMYAAPSPSLPNGVIFSLSHQVDPGGTGSGGGGGAGSSSRSHGNSRQQQLITIPFPVLSATPCSSNRDTEQEAADLSRK